MRKLKKEELLEHLEKTMGHYTRAIMASDQLKQAYQQIKELIERFDEECVKSYKTGYKAGIVNENTRMRKNQPRVTGEPSLKWLITAMSHMKTIYEDNGIPWSAEDEANFQAIYKVVEKGKPAVTEEWIEKKWEKLHLIIREYFFHGNSHNWLKEKAKKFIHSLIEEIRG